MIEKINGVSEKVAGFDARGQVTKEDYDTVVFPAVKEIADRFEMVSFLLILDTDLKNYTVGAWIEDALLGLKNLTKWNRIAIVSDSMIVSMGTKVMNKIVPGQYKTFGLKKLNEAIDWVNDGEVVIS